MHKYFSRIANAITRFVGSLPASILAILVTIVWFLGSFFVSSGLGNSNYQILAQTVTGITTFLMVFFIQHSQNIESTATQLKLDHLINRLEETDNRFVAIEEKTEPELKELKREMLENGLADE